MRGLAIAAALRRGRQILKSRDPFGKRRFERQAATPNADVQRTQSSQRKMDVADSEDLIIDQRASQRPAVPNKTEELSSLLCALSVPLHWCRVAVGQTGIPETPCPRCTRIMPNSAQRCSAGNCLPRELIERIDCVENTQRRNCTHLVDLSTPTPLTGDGAPTSV